MDKIFSLKPLVLRIILIYLSQLNYIHAYEDKYSKMSLHDLTETLYSASTTGNEKEIEEIIQNSRFNDITPEDFGMILFNTMQEGYKNIIEKFIKTRKFNDITPRYLGMCLYLASSEGYEDIIKQIMKHKNFNAITNHDLGTAFYLASQEGHKNIVKMIIENPRFNEISPENLKNALSLASRTGHENIVKMLLRSNIISKIPLEELEEILSQTSHQGSVNWIKTYTALKSNALLKNLNLFENEILKAYQKMLEGNPDYLRALLLPRKDIDPKTGKLLSESRIYAIVPKADAEGIALPLLKKSLNKLFKSEHIKPLLLSLIQTESESIYKFQKDAAMDIIKYMGLTKQDIAASKIQATFKSARSRKNISQKKALEQPNEVKNETLRKKLEDEYKAAFEKRKQQEEEFQENKEYEVNKAR